MFTGRLEKIRLSRSLWTITNIGSFSLIVWLALVLLVHVFFSSTYFWTRGDAIKRTLARFSKKYKSFCITRVDISKSLSHHIYIAAPIYNSVNFVDEHFKSIELQRYPSLTLVYCDDASDDGTVAYIQSRLNFSAFRIYLLRNEQHGGPGLCQWRLVDFIRNIADPMDILIWLDGGDKFFRSDVLQEIDNVFKAKKPWFAYGTHRGNGESICGPPPPVERLREYSKWQVCPPRMTRVFLLKYLTVGDFSMPNGEWLQNYAERRMVNALMELAGPDRIYFFSDSLPQYYQRLYKGLSVWSTLDDVKIENEDHFLNATAFPRLHDTIHMITCTFRRILLFEKYLIKNIASQDIDGRKIILHVCNNGNLTNEEHIKRAVSAVGGIAALELKTFIGNPGPFARFYMMRDAVKKYPVDYFVTIDDDILLERNDSLLQIVNTYKPRQYNTWWGRHYAPFANYSTSIISGMDIRLGQKEQVKTFHYGGIGLSIIDANIARFYFHLLEQIPTAYRFVEDLWLSYVVHQLGWKVERIIMDSINLLESEASNNDILVREYVTKSALWIDTFLIKHVMLEDLRECGWNI